MTLVNNRKVVKRIYKWIKGKHKLIIGLQFVLLLLAVLITINQSRKLRADDVKLQNYHQSLATISKLHQEEWSAHTEAMAHALLLLDAYEAGGMDKAQEIYNGAIDASNKATAKKDAIKSELMKYGIAPAATSDTTPTGI